MRWASLSFWAGRLELSPARSPQRGRLSAISGSALYNQGQSTLPPSYLCDDRATTRLGSIRISTGMVRARSRRHRIGFSGMQVDQSTPIRFRFHRLLHASDQNQITLTPRHVILMLFVASARARGSRVCVFGHQFLDGRRLAGQVSGPGQLMRTMRFRRLTWESSSILSRHRCVSFKSDARSSPWRARSSSPSRHRSTQASVVASAGAVGEVFPIIVSEQQAGT